MSSCAASSCTCCRAALCASATSAFSLTGGEQNFFRFVSVAPASDHPAAVAPPRRPRCPFPRCGDVRFAAEPCRLSSASPPRNSSSDPRLISAGAPHESTSPASNLARASARTLVLCLALSECSMVVRFRLSDAPPHAHSLCDPLLKPKRSDPTANSQTIKTGSSRYKSHSPPGRLPSSRCI
jgi:hypothetical protein